MIREAIIDDATSLDNLLLLLIDDERKYDKNISPLIMILDYYKNFINKENNIFYVYEDNNKVVAYVYAKILNDGTLVKNKAIIDALYVDEEYRKKGIAKSLLNKVLERLSDYDLASIEISVMSSNTIAKKLYEGLGFKTNKETLIKEGE